MPLQRSSRRLHCAVLALLAAAAGALRTAAPPDYHAHGTDWRQGQCSARDAQSPISIDSKLDAPPMDKFEFWYTQIKNVPLALKASHGLLSIDLSQKLWGGVAYNNRWYPLVRLDFHAKSEHQIQGKRYPVEIQLVHREQADPTQSLIVSLLVWSERDPPPPSPILNERRYRPPNPKQMDFNQNVQNFLTVEPPSKEGAQSTLDMSLGLDLGTMVANPKVNGGDLYMSYAGSHTSPPCVRKTQWFVRRLSVIASNEQAKALSDAIYKLTFNNGNYRAIMPVNKRPLIVFRAVPKMKMKVDKDMTLNWGANPRTDGEFQAQQLANYADVTAQRSAHYIEDFARRLGNANAAFANPLRATTTWPPFEATAEGKAAAYAASVFRVRQAIMDATHDAQHTVDASMRWQAGQIHAATLGTEAYVGQLTAQAQALTMTQPPPSR